MPQRNRCWRRKKESTIRPGENRAFSFYPDSASILLAQSIPRMDNLFASCTTPRPGK
jgi:hypothetical protein